MTGTLIRLSKRRSAIWIQALRPAYVILAIRPLHVHCPLLHHMSCSA